MDFPSDGVTLAGDLSPEDVARALETGGVKSWIYMNAESNPAFPKQAKTTLGERFKTVIVDPSALTRGVADDVERAMATLPRPIVVQCSTATRAGIALILHKAK